MKFLFLILFSVSAQAGLINPVASPVPPVTQESSVQARQAETLRRIRERNTQSINMLKFGMTQNFKMIFENPFGLSPQEAFDSLGTDACRAHNAFLGAAQLINSAAQGYWTLTEPCTVSCNPNHTVTVSCPQPSPSPSVSP